MVEKEVLRTAVSKLKYLQKKRYSDTHLDDMSFVYHVFLKYFYNIRKESTVDELNHYFDKKKLAEKEFVIPLVQTLDSLKYQIKKPSAKKVKGLLKDMLDSLKKLEVMYRGEA